MLLSREQTIDEDIVKLLARRPGLGLQEIISTITPNLKKPISLQAWYQTMKRLREKYIIVKVGKRYSVNMSWVQSIERWSSVIKDQEAESQYQKSLNLPVREGVIQKYRFLNMLEMNAFWAHMLIYIAQSNKENGDNNLYGVLPRFWFYLAQEIEERQYIENLKAAGTRSFQVINARSFLDEWNVLHVDKSVGGNYLSKTSSDRHRERYINVIRDYTLEVRLHKHKATMLDKLFTETNSLDVAKRAEIVQFMHEKSPCQIQVYRDQKEREKFVRKVKRYF